MKGLKPPPFNSYYPGSRLNPLAIEQRVETKSMVAKEDVCLFPIGTNRNFLGAFAVKLPGTTRLLGFNNPKNQRLDPPKNQG